MLLSTLCINAQESVIMLENGYIDYTADQFIDEELYSTALNALEILEFTDANVSLISSASHIIEERRAINFLLEAENRNSDIFYLSLIHI